MCKGRYISYLNIVDHIDIKKGEIISNKNIGIIRPGFGLETKHYFKIIGKISRKNLSKGTPFSLEYLKK